MCRLQHGASNTVWSQDIENGKRVNTVPGCHASESDCVSQQPVARSAKLLSGLAHRHHGAVGVGVTRALQTAAPRQLAHPIKQLPCPVQTNSDIFSMLEHSFCCSRGEVKQPIYKFLEAQLPANTFIYSDYFKRHSAVYIYTQISGMIMALHMRESCLGEGDIQSQKWHDRCRRALVGMLDTVAEKLSQGVD